MLRDLAIEASSYDWKSIPYQQRFLDGMLDGAANYLLHAKVVTQTVANAWIAFVGDLVARWPFDFNVPLESQWFPVHTLGRIFDLSWEKHVRSKLFEEFGRQLHVIIRHGTLNDYCDAVIDLTSMINGKAPIAGSTTHSQEILPIAPPVLKELFETCRTAVSRVVQWQNEGKHTRDVAFTQGIDGRGAAELIESVFLASAEREFARQKLTPLCDDLADAGLADVSGKLRTTLRRT